MNEYKTKEDILDDCMRVELGPGEFVYTEDALRAIQLYADQQTSLLTQQLAEKDKEIEILKIKVQKWNDLGQMIAKCYNSYDESGNEIPAKIQDASLLDIGEMAAIAFGYL